MGLNSRTFSMVAGASLLLASCATVVRGPNVDFAVVTDPDGATVVTSLMTDESKRDLSRLKRRGREAEHVPAYVTCDVSPCTFEVSRRAEFTVTVLKEGYHPATVQITSGFGKGGAKSAAGGALVTATGAYVVSYSLYASLIPALTLGLTSGSAAAGVASSAAATGAAGIGIVFLGVDALSGAMLDVRPNPLVLVLIPDHQPLPTETEEVIETQEELEDILERREARPSRVSG